MCDRPNERPPPKRGSGVAKQAIAERDGIVFIVMPWRCDQSPAWVTMKLRIEVFDTRV